jgi:hypothetical protein
VPGSNKGFVLSGRSLREVEQREDALRIHILTAWIISLITLFITIWIIKPRTKKTINNPAPIFNQTETTHPTYKLE